MRSKSILPLFLSVVVALATSPWLLGQKVEISPYAGGLFTPSALTLGSGSFELKEQGLYGIRTGFFLTDNFELEGNLGYLTHFELEGSDPQSRGWLWEASGNYRFDLEKAKPFLTFGVGAITASVDEDKPSFRNAPPPSSGPGIPSSTSATAEGSRRPFCGVRSGFGPTCGDARSRTCEGTPPRGLN